MAFWGFKHNMGRIWATLYLSERPLTARELKEGLGISVGSVSMTLAELERWGVVHVAAGGRVIPIDADRRATLVVDGLAAAVDTPMLSGDWRDWQEVATFADGIAAELTTANPPSFEGG